MKLIVFASAGMFMAAFFTGCASAPTQEERASADYGNDMTQEQCIAITEKVISDTLKDPGSAQFRHNSCTKGYWSSVPIAGKPKLFGWFQSGQVNGKNAFGGYVGFRPYQVLMRNGVPVRWCVSEQNGMCYPIGQ